MTGVQTCALPISHLFRALSSTPAALFGLPGGKLAKGAPADLVVFDPDYAWRVDRDELWSKTKNTPFDERPVQGRAMATIVGMAAWSAAIDMKPETWDLDHQQFLVGSELLVAPVLDPAARAYLNHVLETELDDPTAWVLNSDGSYHRVPSPTGIDLTCAQERFAQPVVEIGRAHV